MPSSILLYIYTCIYNLYIIYVVPKTIQIVCVGVQEANEPNELQGNLSEVRCFYVFASNNNKKKMKKELFKFLEGRTFKSFCDLFYYVVLNTFSWALGTLELHLYPCCPKCIFIINPAEEFHPFTLSVIKQCHSGLWRNTQKTSTKWHPSTLFLPPCPPEGTASSSMSCLDFNDTVCIQSGMFFLAVLTW